MTLKSSGSRSKIRIKINEVMTSDLTVTVSKTDKLQMERWVAVYTPNCNALLRKRNERNRDTIRGSGLVRRSHGMSSLDKTRHLLHGKILIQHTLKEMADQGVPMTTNCATKFCTSGAFSSAKPVGYYVFTVSHDAE